MTRLEYASKRHGCIFIEGVHVDKPFSLLLGKDMPSGRYRFCGGEFLLSRGGAKPDDAVEFGQWFPIRRKPANIFLKDGYGRILHFRSSDNSFFFGKPGMAMEVLLAFKRTLSLAAYFFPYGISSIAFRLMAKIARLFPGPGNRIVFEDKGHGHSDNSFALAFLGLERFRAMGLEPLYAAKPSMRYPAGLERKIDITAPQSLRHRVLTLAARARVTSEANYPPVYPYECYGDLLWDRPVFWLGHGVHFDDMSQYYGRKKQNFSVVFCASQREKDLIFSQGWGYPQNAVKATGLPRWDFLKRKESKTILFIFSWRQYIRGKNVKSSGYFKAIKDIVSDGKIQAAARERGFALKGVLHPRFALAGLEKELERHIEIASGHMKDVLSQASLLVTDHSSVCADAAFMGIPVLFYKFDEEELYRETPMRGPSFDWEGEAPGPVFHTHAEAAGAIVSFMENEPCPQEKYRARAERLFFRIDGENSQRVCGGIEEYFKLAEMDWNGAHGKR